MRKSLTFLFVFSISSVLSLSLLAADKEVKLEGKGQCAKCSLGVADKCQNVLEVKSKGESKLYYLTGEASQAFHGEICSKTKNIKVTGKSSSSDGKNYIAVSKIEAVK